MICSLLLLFETDWIISVTAGTTRGTQRDQLLMFSGGMTQWP